MDILLPLRNYGQLKDSLAFIEDGFHHFLGVLFLEVFSLRHMRPDIVILIAKHGKNRFHSLVVYNGESFCQVSLLDQ